MNELFNKWSILASVVSMASKHMPQVGHTFVQKTVYMLQQALLLKVGYHFKLYHYGPYSEEIWSDLRLLSDIGVLEITPDQNGYGYHISLVKKDPVLEQAQAIPVDEIQEAVDFLSNRDAAGLELLATTHFVKNDLRNKKPSVSFGEISAHVTKLKPHFNTEQVQEALRELKEKEW